MGDFFQNGVITTLHNLTKRPVTEIERELCEYSKRRPMALVLPSLFSELEGPALGPILITSVMFPTLMKSSSALTAQAKNSINMP